MSLTTCVHVCGDTLCIYKAIYIFVDIKEIGHTSNVYCEVAQRSVPTVSDIHLAFIELGIIQ